VATSDKNGGAQDLGEPGRRMLQGIARRGLPLAGKLARPGRRGAAGGIEADQRGSEQQGTAHRISQIVARAPGPVGARRAEAGAAAASPATAAGTANSKDLF